MRALLQRVTEASVSVGGEEIARIGAGMLVLIGVQRGDGPAQAQRLASRLANYRVFADLQGRMNRSVVEVGGDILAVPQFTLAADTAKGRRPSFTSAAPPEIGEALFGQFHQALSAEGLLVQTGRFGADMQVTLCNDGPVTFLLEVPPDPACADYS